MLTKTPLRSFWSCTSRKRPVWIDFKNSESQCQTGAIRAGFMYINVCHVWCLNEVSCDISDLVNLDVRISDLCNKCTLKQQYCEVSYDIHTHVLCIWYLEAGHVIYELLLSFITRLVLQLTDGGIIPDVLHVVWKYGACITNSTCLTNLWRNFKSASI